MERSMADLMQDAVSAQMAIDAMLSPERQEAERKADGTFRVCCSQCGTSVSNPLPVAVIIRAWVECPECIQRRGGAIG